MTEPYTPTTADVRDRYSTSMVTALLDPEIAAEFDAWLSAELAAAERTGAERLVKFIDECAESGSIDPSVADEIHTLAATRALVPSERKSDQ